MKYEAIVCNEHCDCMVIYNVGDVCPLCDALDEICELKEQIRVLEDNE
jgi:hypothetical protein